MEQVERASATLYAVDVPRVAAFYVAVLGMKRHPAEDGFCTLHSAVLELHVIAVPAAIAATITLTEPPQLREDTPIKLGFAVRSIAAARGAAPAYGGAVEAVEREWEWEGVRRCDGHDPEGNVVALLERID